MEPDQKKKVAISKDLLSCGNAGGLCDKLLLKPKTVRSNSSTLQTTPVPRSSVLDRLQLFLPQIAQANEKLKQEMDSCPAGRFDIENVEDAGKVIEMTHLLYNVIGSEREPIVSLWEDNLKPPGNNMKIKEKANILLPSELFCDVALVDLGDSDGDTEDETTGDDSSDSDSQFEGEITEDSLKLPGNNRKIKEKANIKVLDEETV